MRAAPPTGVALVRLSMTEADAIAVKHVLDDVEGEHEQIPLDQLWVMSNLIENRRRVRISERPAFTERGDRVLARLDSQ